MDDRSLGRGSAFEHDPIYVTLARRIGWIIGATIVCVLAAGLWLATRPGVVTASASILIERAGPTNPIDLDVEADIARSAAVLAPVLSEPARADDWYRSSPQPLLALRESLSVEPLGGGRLLFKLTGPDEASAAAVLESVVARYRAYHASREDQRVGQALADAQERVERVRNRVAEAEQDLARFDADHSSAGEQTLSLLRERARVLGASLDSATVSLRELNAEFDAAVRRAMGLGVIDNPIRVDALLDETPEPLDDEATLAARLREAQTAFEQTLRIYLPAHPAVVRQRTELSGLTLSHLLLMRERMRLGWLAQERARSDLAQVEQEAERIDAMVQRRRTFSDTLMTRIAERNTAADEFARVQAIALTERVKLTELQPVMVDRTQPGNDRQVTPVLAGAALTGLIGGSMLAMLVQRSRAGEWTRSRLAVSEQTQTVVDLPLLGVLPRVDHARAALAATYEPLGPMALGIAHVREQLERRHGQIPATLTVLDVEEGGAASVAASNLALTLAAQGRRVLLIDACSASPLLDAVYGLEPTPGLGEVLRAGSIDASVRRTESGVSVMPLGTAPADATTAFDSPRFEWLLRSASSMFDCVILAADSVYPGDAGRVIASSTQSTLLIATAGTTTQRTMSEARNALQLLGANVVGVAVCQ
jgi:Mrp family chromosome partitioning ATPase